MNTLRCAVVVALAWAVVFPSRARGYVEVPYTLGKVIEDSTYIVLVEVTRVNKEKGLVIYKKLRELKGTSEDDLLKHNIGTGDRGFHPREAKYVMSWAAVGQRAVFFCNAEASETCIGNYWYQCYFEEPWWGMSHGEPYLLRTFYGEVDDLAQAVADIVAGGEVIVPCLVDSNRQRLHERKGKLQQLKASMVRQEYDARRDFVGFGADGVDVVETKIDVLLSEGSSGWRYESAERIPESADAVWSRPEFDDRAWRTGKAPIGYGEEELTNRGGTLIEEHGQAFVFRRSVDVPAALLTRQGVTFQLRVAADNCALVYINGETILDEGEEDHEFAYWNQEVELEPRQLRPGRNLIVVYVPNGPESSDLFLDLQLDAETPLPKKPSPKAAAAKRTPAKTTNAKSSTPAPRPAKKPLVPPAVPAVKIGIDKKLRIISIPAQIAVRKLPNLSEIYPLEVVATAPPPRGRKAHETVVVTDAKPSQVHAALVALGLAPGAPAKGDDSAASGPEVALALRFADKTGKTRTVPIEEALVNTASSDPLPKLKWLFTGSAFRQPDPELDETVYAADLSGTLVTIFPVTNETVLQSDLLLGDDASLKLEMNRERLPPEGTPVELIISAK